MALLSRSRVTALVLVLAAYGAARAGDPDEYSLMIPLAGMEQGRDDHTREVLPVRPGVTLRYDGKDLRQPIPVDALIVERPEGDRLLVKERGICPRRGWVAARDMVPLTKAEAYFSASIAADGRQPFPFLMRGVLRHHLKQDDLSLADLDATLRLEPASVDALAWRATIQSVKKHDERAFADINRAIELSPSQPELFMIRSKMHRRSREKKIDQALADIDRAIQLDQSNPTLALDRAMTYKEYHQRKKALAELSRVLERFPQGDVLLMSALLMIKWDEKPAARRILAARLAQHPDADLAYRCHIALGSADLMDWKFFAAMSELDDAIAIDPRNEDAYLLKSKILVLFGFDRKAIDELNAAIRSNPSTPDCYELRGVLHYRRHEYTAALTDLNTALRLRPDDPEIHERVALMLATCPDPRVRNGQNAVASATRACELSGWRSPECLDTLAAAEAAIGRFEAAADHEGKAISLLPQYDLREDDYRRLLARYEDHKPAYRLSLLEEWGIRKSRRD